MTSMVDVPELRTGRLHLRGWTADDREAFAAINADPAVMEFLGGPITGERSDELVERIHAEFTSRGFGLWAVEVPGSVPFIGFVGLMTLTYEAHFTPAVEVGWRLARAAWGHGYASEAAREVLRFAFADAGLAEVVSTTAFSNVRSQRVMQRIGMHRDPGDDYDHPRIPPGHPLRRHVLYRIHAEGHRRNPHAGPAHQEGTTWATRASAPPP